VYKTKAQHSAGRYHQILDDIEVSSHHLSFTEVMVKGRDFSTPGLYYCGKGNTIIPIKKIATKLITDHKPSFFWVKDPTCPNSYIVAPNQN
jgi:hypothetical protein